MTAEAAEESATLELRWKWRYVHASRGPSGKAVSGKLRVANKGVIAPKTANNPLSGLVSKGAACAEQEPRMVGPRDPRDSMQHSGSS